jgi:hypothetical protein
MILLTKIGGDFGLTLAVSGWRVSGFFSRECRKAVLGCGGLEPEVVLFGMLGITC